MQVSKTILISILLGLPLSSGQQMFRAYTPALPITASIIGNWSADSCTPTSSIATITDSASTPHNLTAAGGAQPTCIAGIANGRNVARFNGTGNVMNSTSFAQSQAFTIFMVVANVTQNGSGAPILLSSNPASSIRLENSNSNGVNSNGVILALFSLYAGSFAAFNPGGGLYGSSAVNGASAQNLTTLAHSKPSLITAVFNGASSSIQISGNASQTGNPGGASIGSGMWLGNFSSGSFFSAMDFSALIICNSTLSAANSVAIQNYLIARYGVVGQRNITFDGDSLSNAYQLSNISQGWPAQFLAANPTYAGNAPAIASQTCAQISTNFAALHSLDFTTLNSKNIYWLWCGTNDLFFSGTAASLETTVSAIATAAHAAGLKIGFMDIIARGGSTPGGFETQRQLFNTWAVANSSTFDAFVDLGSNSTIGCPTVPANCYTNATYFQSDQTHLTQTGYALVVSLASSAILGL